MSGPHMPSRRARIILQVSGWHVSSDLVPNSPQNIWISPFAQYTVTQIYSHSVFWESTRERACSVAMVLQRPPACCLETQPPHQTVCSSSEDWLISRSGARDGESNGITTILSYTLHLSDSHHSLLPAESS